MQENTISSFIEARMADQKRSHLHILLIISIIFTAILAYFFHLLKKEAAKNENRDTQNQSRLAHLEAQMGLNKAK